MDIVNFLFSVPRACLATHIQRGTINLLRAFVFICWQKINFIHHVLLEILQRYAKFLFWALWACLPTYMQNDSINLKKILMFIRSVYSLLPWDITFQRILQFVGPTAFWPTTKILPVWGWWWNINNYISFHFNLLWEKTIDKIFQKAQKTLFWGPFSDFFTQTLAQMNFPGKKRLKSSTIVRKIRKN